MTLEQALAILLAVSGLLASIIGVLIIKIVSKFDTSVERALTSLESLNLKMAIICERVDSHEKRVDLHEKRINDLEKV